MPTPGAAAPARRSCHVRAAAESSQRLRVGGALRSSTGGGPQAPDPGSCSAEAGSTDLDPFSIGFDKRVVVHEVELVLGLLVAVAALGLLARRISTPYPIVLVVGGLLIGLLPFHVSIHLEPEIVFLLFLPPLLYVAAFFTSIRDFRANAKPILSLAIGLVLATTAGVASSPRRSSRT